MDFPRKGDFVTKWLGVGGGGVGGLGHLELVPEVGPPSPLFRHVRNSRPLTSHLTAVEWSQRKGYAQVRAGTGVHPAYAVVIRNCNLLDK